MARLEVAVPITATLVAILLGLGCATPKQPFMHGSHRETYAFEDRELRELQLYISTQVLVHQVPGAGATLAPESVILLPEETAGVVTEVGADWLRVSFEEGGQGVPFAVATGRVRDSVYWIATEVEGQPGFRPIRELPEKVLRQQGQDYRIRYGASAYLLVDSGDLRDLIEARRHLKGRPR